MRLMKLVSSIDNQNKSHINLYRGKEHLTACGSSVNDGADYFIGTVDDTNCNHCRSIVNVLRAIELLG